MTCNDVINIDISIRLLNIEDVKSLSSWLCTDATTLQSGQQIDQQLLIRMCHQNFGEHDVHQEWLRMYSLSFVIISNDTHATIGMIQVCLTTKDPFHYPNNVPLDSRIQSPCITIGYSISPLYRGKGIATNAVQKVMKLIQTNLGIHGPWYLYMIHTNIPSKRVAEKSGFRYLFTQYNVPRPTMSLLQQQETTKDIAIPKWWNDDKDYNIDWYVYTN